MKLKDDYKRIVLVVDALDECDYDTRTRFLAFLARLLEPGDTLVKIIASSRNQPEMLDCLGKCHGLYVNASDNAEDIQNYIDQEIDTRLLCGRAAEDIKTKVKRTLFSKARGM